MTKLKERISLIGVKTKQNSQYVQLLESNGYQVDSLTLIDKHM